MMNTDTDAHNGPSSVHHDVRRCVQIPACGATEQRSGAAGGFCVLFDPGRGTVSHETMTAPWKRRKQAATCWSSLRRKKRAGSPQLLLDDTYASPATGTITVTSDHFPTVAMVGVLWARLCSDDENIGTLDTLVFARKQ